jgi:hypothetical protein
MVLPPEKLRAYGPLIDILVEELLRDAQFARNDFDLPLVTVPNPEPEICSAQKAERAERDQVDRQVADDLRRG